MEPKDMNAAQALDITIEALLKAGPEHWYRGGLAHDPNKFESMCFVARWNKELFYLCSSVTLMETVSDACRRLFNCCIVDLSDTHAVDFEDFISKLRTIKSAL